MPGRPTYLDRIVAAHRTAAAIGSPSVRDLAAAAAAAPPPRDFAGSLGAVSSAGDLAVIAEVKRRSPSKGAFASSVDAAAVAASYEAGGAACLSVLTDGDFFGGSADDLRAAREATGLPVLRKDFTVSERDVYETRAMGADAVLLIVAALDRGELARFHALAVAIGLAALVEVHDEEELDAALEVGATLVGVNQRDLVTFEVDTARAARVASAIPAGVFAVAESGISGVGAAAALRAAGYGGVLVGETLMRSADRAAAVAELRAAGAGAPAR